MIFLEPADVVLVASRVSGTTVEETLAGTDFDSVQRILEQAQGGGLGRSGDDALARVAATLLVELVRQAWFGDGTGAVALACVLQLLGKRPFLQGQPMPGPRTNDTDLQAMPHRVAPGHQGGTGRAAHRLHVEGVQDRSCLCLINRIPVTSRSFFISPRR